MCVYIGYVDIRRTVPATENRATGRGQPDLKTQFSLRFHHWICLLLGTQLFSKLVQIYHVVCMDQMYCQVN